MDGNNYSFFSAVVDPAFLSQGGMRQPRDLGQKTIIWQDVCQNCMKMKTIGPRGGTFLAPHWILQCSGKDSPVSVTPPPLLQFCTELHYGLRCSSIKILN